METQANQFQMLRGRIETSLKSPYSVLITSATESDGKHVCAQGLADSFGATGRKTLFLDLDHNQRRVRNLPTINSLAFSDPTDEINRAILHSQNAPVVSLSMSSTSLSASATRENVAALLSFLKLTFQTIIVESAVLPKSSIGGLFASECDVVIATTLENRPIRFDDHELLSALERDRIRFFGVVTISADVITNYDAKATILHSGSVHQDTTEVGRNRKNLLR